jgi:hypothetical protein
MSLILTKIKVKEISLKMRKLLIKIRVLTVKTEVGSIIMSLVSSKICINHGSLKIPPRLINLAFWENN